MHLEFTAEQDELRDGVRTMLARECPIALVREVVEKGSAPDTLWAQMVELGWPALTVPEYAGGLGMGTVELAVVVEELGRVLAPGPFLPTVTQFAPVVAEAGSTEQQERFLGGVATGEITGTLALVEDDGSIDPGRNSSTASPDGDGFVLEGTKVTVLEATVADEIAVVARQRRTDGSDGVGAFVVPRADVRVEPVEPLDASRPLARVALDGVRVGADRVLGEPGPTTAAAIARAVEVATTALAVETVGAAQAIFDITLAYAKQREQFGEPIGSFQAIKHKFADMLVALERARATSYFAALTIAEDDDRRSLAASIAKAAAGDCAALLAKEGIQIHGGIGYTWEHDMHLYVRRVKSNSLLFGSAAQHRARVADLIGL
ncbi:MAG TPA: acyl-CoA dehydrogenase family protein [Acidimicrobiia bacterium]|nr:acyl-CoA dehydrogenase family protein [Acidimicrobiia bacterium]